MQLLLLLLMVVVVVQPSQLDADAKEDEHTVDAAVEQRKAGKSLSPETCVSV